ncbi:MAG: exopolysaccharide biosynthesis protein [Pseudomonadota bacterium]
MSTDLTDLAEDVSDTAATAEEVSFGDILDQVGRGAYGPLLFLPALLAVAPTGAIPGMSILTGTLIILVAVQLVAGRKTPWIPAWLEKKQIAAQTVDRSLDRARPYLRQVDEHTHPALTFLFSEMGMRLIGVASIALALTMFPLALVPFGVAVPGITVALLATAIIVKDGRLLIAAALMAAATLWLLTYALG